MELINESHKFTEVTNNYILPANPSYFDIEDYFEKTNEVAWDEIKSIRKDDYVYLYVTKPYQSIMYKLRVTAVGNNEMISVNERVAKASYDVKVGDIIEIRFGDKVSKYKILKIVDHPGKDTGNLVEELK